MSAGIGPGYGGALPSDGGDYGCDELVQGHETGEEAPAAAPATASAALDMEKSTAGGSGLESAKRSSHA